MGEGRRDGAGPYAGGGGGGFVRHPLETAGIDFYSGFRKNGQGGGGANRNPKKSRYRLLQWLHEKLSWGGAHRNPIKRQV